MAETTIVLVGHCGFDAPRLEREIGRCCPSFEVLTINSDEELEEIVEQEPDLLLVNRQLPYGFETEEGVELISELHREHPETEDPATWGWTKSDKLFLDFVAEAHRQGRGIFKGSQPLANAGGK